LTAIRKLAMIWDPMERGQRSRAAAAKRVPIQSRSRKAKGFAT